MNELFIWIIWACLAILIVIACYKQIRERIRVHKEIREFGISVRVIRARFEALVMQFATQFS